MNDCVFCRIARGDIPTSVVYEDANVFAFEDASPQAAVHILIIPRAHVANLLEATALPDETLAGLLRAAAAIARQKGLDQTGFRLISNCGQHACQSVGHLHFHLLGGEQLPAQLV